MSNTTWHESGHAVFANIFNDFLTIEGVTIAPGHYGKGANLIATKRTSGTIYDAYQFVIVNLAGLVVEYTANDRDNPQIFKNIYKYIEKRLQSTGISDAFDGDFSNIQNSLTYLSETLKIEKHKIVAVAIVYIKNCLTRTNEFWYTIEKIVLELDRKKTLDKSELKEIFKTSGMNDFLQRYRTAYILESKENLKELVDEK